MEAVCGAPDWLIVRGSSLFGLHAITDEMSSQFGLGSLVRDGTDRVTVSEGRGLSCPVRASCRPGIQEEERMAQAERVHSEGSADERGLRPWGLSLIHI